MSRGDTQKQNTVCSWAPLWHKINSFPLCMLDKLLSATRTTLSWIKAQINLSICKLICLFFFFYNFSFCPLRPLQESPATSGSQFMNAGLVCKVDGIFSASVWPQPGRETLCSRARGTTPPGHPAFDLLITWLSLGLSRKRKRLQGWEGGGTIITSAVVLTVTLKPLWFEIGK